MKILILSDIETAGEWILTQTIVEQLKKRDKLEFFLLAYGKNKIHLQENLFEKIILINRTPLIAPFRYYRQILLEFILGVRSLNQIKKITGQTDYVVTTNEYSLFISSLLVFPFSKNIFCVQGLRHTDNQNLENFNLYLLIRKFLERFAWFISQKIVVPSDKAKNIVEKELGIFSRIKKVKIIPNIISEYFFVKHTPVDLFIFREKINLPKDSKIILYSGRIDSIKGIKNLLSSFIQLRRKIKKANLIIAYTDVKADKQLFNSLIKIVKDNRINQ